MLHGASALTREELLALSESHGVLLLNPKEINSEEELLLAEKLARDAIKEKRNVARRLELEFLLFLSAGTDITRAFAKYGFAGPDELLLISFSIPKPRLVKIFGMAEAPLLLRKEAGPMEIERISLSRISG